MEKIKLLIGAYYCENNNCAQIDEIFKYIDEDGSIIQNELNELQLDYLQSEINKYKELYEKLDVNKKNYTKEKFYKIFDNMINCFYNEFNILEMERPKITIVEKFPHPFEDRNYKAMTFSELHEKQFNVPKGIYLLEKYAIHGISEIMIAHEIMHYVLNNLTPKDELLNQEPFLSEGIVDFMSQYLLLKYNIIDEICLKNWIEFGRANCTIDFIGNLYFREAKQILLIAKKCGISEVKKLIKEGMKKLSTMDMDEYCFKDNINIEDKVLNKLISFYDTALCEFVLNVDEVYLFNYLLGKKDGVMINDISLKLLTQDKIKNTLNCLQKLGLIYILDDKVYNTNFKMFSTIKIKLF